MLRIRRTSSAVHVRRRDLLSYRDFRSAISAQFLSQSSDALTSFTLAEILVFSFSDGPSLSAMAWALLISALPLIFVGPLAGHLADRLNRKLLLNRGHVIRAAITFCAISATVHRFHFIGYIAFGILPGLTRVLYTARATAFPRLVRKHELVAADSTSLIIGVIAGSVGASIGLMLTKFSPALALLVATFGQCAAAWLYGRISVDLGRGTPRRRHGNLASVFAQLRKQKTKFAMFATASHRFVLGACIASISLLVDSAYGLRTTGYVAVLGFSAAGAFCGSLSAEWVSEHLPRRSITVIAFSASSAVLLISSLISSPRIALISISVASFLFQNLRVRSDATIQANVSRSNIGQVFAAYDMLYNIAFIVGAILGIGLNSQFSHSVVFATASIGFAVMACVFAAINDGKTDVEKIEEFHPSIWRKSGKNSAIAV